MKSQLNNINISCVATAVPENKLKLAELGNLFGEEETNLIITHTGVQEIRVAPKGICASDLCEAAARNLFIEYSIDPSTIDAIVFVSQTSDYIFPATSSVLQHKLGLSKNTFTLDINQGCSGYIYGLYMASMLIQSKSCNRVLMLAGDVLTRHINDRDRSIRMLIGDGGSATIIESGNSTLSFSFKTDGSGYQNVIIPAGGSRLPSNESTKIEIEKEFGNIRCENNFYMNGMEVMNFVLREIPPIITELLKTVNWTLTDVDFFGFHQANKFVIEYLAKRLKIKIDKVPITVMKYGNTSSSSIPIMLSESFESLKAENRINKVVLCGFGVGLTVGALACDLADTRILKTIEIN